jgi:hypothetical protein
MKNYKCLYLEKQKRKKERRAEDHRAWKWWSETYFSRYFSSWFLVVALLFAVERRLVLHAAMAYLNSNPGLPRHAGQESEPASKEHNICMGLPFGHLKPLHLNEKSAAQMRQVDKSRNKRYCLDSNGPGGWCPCFCLQPCVLLVFVGQFEGQRY